jgi:molecular chaperone HtpG
LAGLSYSEKLIFTTSAKGEPVATVVAWDSKKMREMIRPDHAGEEDLISVIESIVTYKTVSEDVEKHYFTVELVHVDERFSQLLDEQDIRSYLSQVGPVPFRADKFPYYSDKKTGIRKKVELLGKELEEYNVYINGDPNPLYKGYKTWITTSKDRDDIREIRYFEEFHPTGELFFWGWYGMSTFRGYVKDHEVQGLRVRKHNIQIGDERTLDSLFSQDRFNRWFVGEIHVYDKDIIPNARRDDFEKNDIYFKFRDRLEKYTIGLLSKIPTLYSNVNSAVAKIEASKSSLQEIEAKLEEGVNSEVERENLFKKRDQIKSNIVKGKKEIEKSKSKIVDRILVEKITKTLAETEKLEKKSNEIENKIIDAEFNSATAKALSSYTKDTRKVVYRIFDVIEREVEPSVAKNIQEAILTELSMGKVK